MDGAKDETILLEAAGKLELEQKFALQQNNDPKHTVKATKEQHSCIWTVQSRPRIQSRIKSNTNEAANCDYCGKLADGNTLNQELANHQKENWRMCDVLHVY